MPIPENPILLASSTNRRALGPKIRKSAPLDWRWADFRYPSDLWLCFSQRTPEVTGRGPSWFRSCCNIFMNCSSMLSRPKPHRHDISARLKLGVIMSSMAIQQTAINCRRNISGPLQILPSLSNLAFIYETKRSSSELVDLAAAHSDSITSTRSTTRSDSINMTRVLAAPASSGTIIFSFHRILIH